MPLGDYLKTTWVNGGAPGLSAPRLNNIENKTAELDLAQAAHQADLATEISASHVELATAAETTTGTDGTRAVHPAGLKVELDKKLNKAGDTATGILAAQANTSYTVAQLHNVILSTSDAVIGSMGNGDLWVKYV